MPQIETFRPAPGALPTRNVIPSRYTWDLTAICRDWDDWAGRYGELESAIASFVAFQGTLATGPDRLLTAFRAMDAMGALSYRV